MRTGPASLSDQDWRFWQILTVDWDQNQPTFSELRSASRETRPLWPTLARGSRELRRDGFVTPRFGNRLLTAAKALCSPDLPMKLTFVPEYQVHLMLSIGAGINLRR